MTEADIAKIIEVDPWMMKVLSAAESLNLPDWWIGAGFLRNKVWDHISGNVSEPTRDVDLVYFNDIENKPEDDWAYDELLKSKYPFAEWEVRNQARMHYKNGSEPYASTYDGISDWVETATCVAVKLEKGILKFMFCYGMDDLVGLVARPIPSFQTKDKIAIFHKRVREKGWRTRWPKLRF